MSRLGTCIPCAAAATPLVGFGQTQKEFPMLNLIIFVGIAIGVSFLSRKKTD